jgi:hypothetical protein
MCELAFLFRFFFFCFEGPGLEGKACSPIIRMDRRMLLFAKYGSSGG